jgi:hypothetical protein
MTAQARVREVFGYFHNLNLLALLENLGRGRTAKGAWLSDGALCPVAHALPSGRYVRELVVLEQATDVRYGCDYAAQHIGAEPDNIMRFLQWWDGESDGDAWLQEQLQRLWEERLSDADAMQKILQDPT